MSNNLSKFRNHEKNQSEDKDDDATMITVTDPHLYFPPRKRKREAQNPPRKRKRGAQKEHKNSNKHTKTKKSHSLTNRNGHNSAITPFWTDLTMEKSKKLLSCTKEDCVSLDSSLWNTSAKKLLQKSWFTVQQTELKKTTKRNSQKNCQIYQSLKQEIMDLNQEKTKGGEINLETEEEQKEDQKSEKAKAGKTIKIRVYPNSDQKRILNRWFDTARWTYNQVVEAIRKGAPRKKKELRAKCVNNDNFKDQNQWAKETPYDIRDEAMNDVLKAYASNFALERKEFTIRFKKKKSEHDSIVILSKHWKRAGIFHPTEWGKEPLKSSQPLPDKLPYDSRLQKTRLGEFYLCIPQPLVIRPDNQGSENNNQSRIISLDPGNRTFCTGYDPSGKIIEFGKNDKTRIGRLCYALDKLQSKWSQKDVRHNKRYKYQKAARRIRKKIRNLVDEFHKKFSRWLCENYDIILLPIFETQRMVQRRNRKISSKTARSLLTWSHFRFRTRLLHKTREFPNCKVILCNEAFTSKTCGECGHLHQKLGGSKDFVCPNCHQESDRDFNASRNILLRFLTSQTSNLALSPSSLASKEVMQDLNRNVRKDQDVQV